MLLDADSPRRRLGQIAGDSHNSFRHQRKVNLKIHTKKKRFHSTHFLPPTTIHEMCEVENTNNIIKQQQNNAVKIVNPDPKNC